MNPSASCFLLLIFFIFFIFTTITTSCVEALIDFASCSSNKLHVKDQVYTEEVTIGNLDNCNITFENCSMTNGRFRFTQNLIGANITFLNIDCGQDQSETFAQCIIFSQGVQSGNVRLENISRTTKYTGTSAPTLPLIKIEKTISFLTSFILRGCSFGATVTASNGAKVFLLLIDTGVDILSVGDSNHPSIPRELEFSNNKMFGEVTSPMFRMFAQTGSGNKLDGMDKFLIHDNVIENLNMVTVPGSGSVGVAIVNVVGTVQLTTSYSSTFEIKSNRMRNITIKNSYSSVTVRGLRFGGSLKQISFLNIEDFEITNTTVYSKTYVQLGALVFLSGITMQHSSSTTLEEGIVLFRRIICEAESVVWESTTTEAPGIVLIYLKGSTSTVHELTLKDSVITCADCHTKNAADLFAQVLALVPVTGTPPFIFRLLNNSITGAEYKTLGTSGANAQLRILFIDSAISNISRLDVHGNTIDPVKVSCPGGGVNMQIFYANGAIAASEDSFAEAILNFSQNQIGPLPFSSSPSYSSSLERDHMIVYGHSSAVKVVIFLPGFGVTKFIVFNFTQNTISNISASSHQDVVVISIFKMDGAAMTFSSSAATAEETKAHFLSNSFENVDAATTGTLNIVYVTLVHADVTWNNVQETIMDGMIMKNLNVSSNYFGRVGFLRMKTFQSHNSNGTGLFTNAVLTASRIRCRSRINAGQTDGLTGWEFRSDFVDAGDVTISNTLIDVSQGEGVTVPTGDLMAWLVIFIKQQTGQIKSLLLDNLEMKGIYQGTGTAQVSLAVVRFVEDFNQVNVTLTNSILDPRVTSGTKNIGAAVLRIAAMEGTSDGFDRMSVRSNKILGEYNSTGSYVCTAMVLASSNVTKFAQYDVSDNYINFQSSAALNFTGINGGGTRNSSCGANETRESTTAPTTTNTSTTTTSTETTVSTSTTATSTSTTNATTNTTTAEPTTLTNTTTNTTSAPETSTNTSTTTTTTPTTTTTTTTPTTTSTSTSTTSSTTTSATSTTTNASTTTTTSSSSTEPNSTTTIANTTTNATLEQPTTTTTSTTNTSLTSTPTTTTTTTSSTTTTTTTTTTSTEALLNTTAATSNETTTTIEPSTSTTTTRLTAPTSSTTDVPFDDGSGQTKTALPPDVTKPESAFELSDSVVAIGSGATTASSLLAFEQTSPAIASRTLAFGIIVSACKEGKIINLASLQLDEPASFPQSLIPPLAIAENPFRRYLRGTILANVFLAPIALLSLIALLGWMLVKLQASRDKDRCISAKRMYVKKYVDLVAKTKLVAVVAIVQGLSVEGTSFAIACLLLASPPEGEIGMSYRDDIIFALLCGVLPLLCLLLFAIYRITIFRRHGTCDPARLYIGPSSTKLKLTKSLWLFFMFGDQTWKLRDDEEEQKKLETEKGIQERQFVELYFLRWLPLFGRYKGVFFQTPEQKEAEKKAWKKKQEQDTLKQKEQDKKEERERKRRLLQLSPAEKKQNEKEQEEEEEAAAIVAAEDDEKNSRIHEPVDYSLRDRIGRHIGPYNYLFDIIVNICIGVARGLLTVGVIDCSVCATILLGILALVMFYEIFVGPAISPASRIVDTIIGVALFVGALLQVLERQEVSMVLRYTVTFLAAGMMLVHGTKFLCVVIKTATMISRYDLQPFYQPEDAASGGNNKDGVPTSRSLSNFNFIDALGGLVSALDEGAGAGDYASNGVGGSLLSKTRLQQHQQEEKEPELEDVLQDLLKEDESVLNKQRCRNYSVLHLDVDRMDEFEQEEMQTISIPKMQQAAEGDEDDDYFLPPLVKKQEYEQEGEAEENYYYEEEVSSDDDDLSKLFRPNYKLKAQKIREGNTFLPGGNDSYNSNNNDDGVEVLELEDHYFDQEKARKKDKERRELEMYTAML